MRSLVAISVTLVALASGSLAELARADGDPASDVLATQTLFLPQDAGVPAGQQVQLAMLLAAATRTGYRLRVAMIASTAYGLYSVQGPTGRERAALAGLGAPRDGLGSATLTAIERLAAAAGHPLPAPSIAAPAGSRATATLPWIVFAIGVAVILLAWIASFRARPLHLQRP